MSYVPNSPRELVPTTPNASSHSSPITANHYQPNEGMSPKIEASNASSSSNSSASRVSVMNGGSIMWKSSEDQLVSSIGSAGFNNGGGGSATAYR